mmetsp:Transcript_22137/g.61598  ORF Transcript_22137/g.61598 Transcript_22137/m.61598 type:complete len:211 (-) Transcript_22137:1123-1755(-)
MLHQLRGFGYLFHCCRRVCLCVVVIIVILGQFLFLYLVHDSRIHEAIIYFVIVAVPFVNRGIVFSPDLFSLPFSFAFPRWLSSQWWLLPEHPQKVGETHQTQKANDDGGTHHRPADNVQGKGVFPAKNRRRTYDPAKVEAVGQVGRHHQPQKDGKENPERQGKPFCEEPTRQTQQHLVCRQPIRCVFGVLWIEMKLEFANLTTPISPSCF